jgi:hypothetical protein
MTLNGPLEDTPVGLPKGGSRDTPRSYGSARFLKASDGDEAAGPPLPLRRHRVRDQPRRDRSTGATSPFDQAHLGHEFRALTGLAPTRYVEVRQRFLREYPGHALDGWPLPPIDLLQGRQLTTR